MRTGYQRQLKALSVGIAELCDLAGTAMHHATSAVLDGDLALAEQVMDDRDNIGERAAEVERDVVRLLALQAPVARDLRAVIAGMHSIADADRMGVLAMHIAEAARRRHPQLVVPEEVHDVFSDMGRVAVAMSRHTRDAVLASSAELAAELVREDDAVDALHRELFGLVMDPRWSHGAATAVDVTLLSRYYERFSDHAVWIGRRVIYQCTGSTAA